MKSTYKHLASLAISSTLLMTACQAPGNTNYPPAPEPTPNTSATPTPMPTPTMTPGVDPTPMPTMAPTTPPVSGSEMRYAARLTGSQEVPAVDTTASGSARVYLNADKTVATVQVTTSGLSGPITGAHIHNGIAGSNGDVVKALDIQGNVLTATWRTNDNVTPLTADLINDLMNGGLYINVHTAEHPNGEIRGQINGTTDWVYPVYLSSAQEVPALMSGSTGTANVRLKADQSAIMIEGYAHNLSGEITGAHVHMGGKDTNGDVVKPLIVDGNKFSITWSKTDAENPLTTDLINDLMAGDLYLNVHTPSHPNGEIRGQISTTEMPMDNRAMSYFTTELTGGNEVPVVEGNGYGAVEMVLDGERDTVTLEARVSGLTGPITGAHIHKGSASENGAVVKALTVNNDRITATWNRTDTEFPFTSTLLNDLLTGNLYVNVHTAANPNGEVRGQLMSTLNKVYTVQLEGSQEVPAVTGDAEATAWVMLSPDHRTITVKGLAHNLSGDITGAHIHMGPIGLSGPVVKPMVVTGNTFAVTWTPNDNAEPLTPGAVEQLMDGELYLNVHTAANPNGEVRGQIVE